VAARAQGASGEKLPDAVAADLPDWLWEKLGAVYGEDERKALSQAWLSAAPLDVRVNPLKTTRDEARAALAATGIDAQPTPYSPLGLRIAGRPSLTRHPLFTPARSKCRTRAASSSRS
jgi:16S rRNA (cytosine967-C5)-methyltransferase